MASGGQRDQPFNTSRGVLVTEIKIQFILTTAIERNRLTLAIENVPWDRCNNLDRDVEDELRRGAALDATMV